MKKNFLNAIIIANLTLISTISPLYYSYANEINTDFSVDSEINSIGTFLDYSSDKYYNELKAIGFTEQEMLDLYKQESSRLGIEITLPKKLEEEVNVEKVVPILAYRSPNNIMPRSLNSTGEYVTKDFSVDMISIARAIGYPSGMAGVTDFLLKHSAKELAKGIVKTVGLGSVGVALGLASWVLQELSAFTGINPTLHFTQTLYYGEDNHGGVSWTPGPISNPYFTKN